MPIARPFAAAFAALALLLPAVVPAAELTIAVARTPLSLPFYVAEAQDYFRAEGVTVRSTECLGGQACIKQLFAGSAQLATASDLPVMFNSFERSDYAVLATFAQARSDTRLIAHPAAGIGSAQQLAGKRIGTVTGSSSHYWLDAFLLYHGIDPAQVTIVPLAPEKVPEALGSRQVEAAAVYEPWAWLAHRAAGAGTVVLPDPRIYTLSFNLVGDRRSIGAREDDLQAVLRALARAVRYIRAEPARAQAVMRQRLHLEQGFVDWVWPDLDYRLGLDQSFVSTVESELRWALREGHVKTSVKRVPNVLDLLDPGPLRKAVPGSVTVTK